ncbi:MAG: DUF3995 domain-containing protein [Paracoccaceae bacterium]
MTWILATILAALAALHLLWAIGFWWPIRDETQLARAIAGFKDIRTMPGAVPSALVAVALIAVIWLLMGWPIGIWRSLGLGGAAAVFILRGLAAYSPAWRRITPEMPFARLDWRYYGPLCLIIGAGLVLQL